MEDYRNYKKKERFGAPRIKEEKLVQPLKRVGLLEIGYVRHAKSVAIRMSKGEYVHPDELWDIRLDAMADKDNLKGDFVISVFLDMIEQGVPFERWEKGKALKVDEKLAKKIYENEVTKEMSVTEFCKQNRLTRNKYYRIARCDVKDAGKRAELEAIKASVLERH